MTREKWRGNEDLSYRWRAAWSGDKLYFLFEVTDDRVIPAGQTSSYLCDCISQSYRDYVPCACCGDGRHHVAASVGESSPDANQHGFRHGEFTGRRVDRNDNYFDHAGVVRCLLVTTE